MKSLDFPFYFILSASKHLQHAKLLHQNYYYCVKMCRRSHCFWCWLFILTLNHVIITCPEPVRILAVTDMRTLEQISSKQRQDDEDSLICYHQQTVQRSAEKNIWSQWWIKCNVLALAFKVGRQCIIIGASSLAMKTVIFVLFWMLWDNDFIKTSKLTRDVHISSERVNRKISWLALNNNNVLDFKKMYFPFQQQED